MAEVLGFDEKISGLVTYYEALRKMDPSDPSRSDMANPNFFYYGDGFHASNPLAEAKRGVIYDIECHARAEYGRRGLNNKDLRKDTEEELIQRADVLAVMTAPLKSEVRQARTQRIAGLLANLAAGETVRMTEYGCYTSPVEVELDVSRALFGVFANGHISSRTLTIQYDTPVTFPPERAGESAVKIDISSIFKSPDFLGEALPGPVY